MHPSMRLAFSRKYVKSGSTRSIPNMSMSGNMSPQSSSMMRPSTSIHAQLRPISPNPPRKVTTTGSGMKVGVDLSRSVFGSRGRGPEGRPALADPKAERAHHRLDRLREHTGVAVLEQVRLDEPCVDLARAHDVTLLEGGDHVAGLGTGPVRRRTHDADGPDGEQRQRHRDVAAVDVEVWHVHGEPGGRRRSR